MTGLDISQTPRGVLATQRLVEVVAEHGESAEHHYLEYLELKSTLGLSRKKIAEFVLGTKHRVPSRQEVRSGSGTGVAFYGSRGIRYLGHPYPRDPQLPLLRRGTRCTPDRAVRLVDGRHDLAAALRTIPPPRPDRRDRAHFSCNTSARDACPCSAECRPTQRHCPEGAFCARNLALDSTLRPGRTYRLR